MLSVECLHRLDITLNLGLADRFHLPPPGNHYATLGGEDITVTGNEVSASRRAHEALPSPIRKLSPLAEQAKAEGVHIYHLNIGQPDLTAPEALLNGVRGYLGEMLPYAPSQGLPETVDAWLEYYRNVGVQLERDQLLVTTGGSEALLFALMAVADPGDEVIVFEPTYANYFGFARMTNVEIVPVTLSAQNGFHLPERERIESCITSRTRALLIATPGNPTGTVFSYAELEMLADIALEQGLFLISDETYREIVFAGQRDMSALKVLGADERTIIVDSVSKRFSATGARIGCVASRHEGVMDGILRFAQARLSSPTVEQRAIVPLLRESGAYTDPLASIYRGRRDVVLDGLREIPGAFARPPEGAFYVLASLPIDDGETFARWLLSDFRLGGESVMIAPGEGFYVPRPDREPHLGRKQARIAFVLEEEALGRAMVILREALRVYPGREADS